MSSAGLLVWAQFWQVTFAILLVGLISWRWGRRHPHLIHLLWMLVIVKTLIPPLWSSPTGLFSWTNTLAETWMPESLIPSADPWMPDATIGFDAPATERPPIKDPVVASAPVPRTFETARSVWEQSLRDGRALWESYQGESVLFVIWLGGCLILLAGAMTQWCRLCRVLANHTDATPDWMESLVERVRFSLGLRRRFRVVVNTAGIGPLVLGYFRPTLVIPVELAQVDRRRRLEPVIAHEMIHARRGDTLFALIQFVSQIVCWFHPLVWWANRQANRYCEQCCDEETVLGLSCKPDEYAHCLLDVLELKRKLRAVPGFAGVRSSQVTAARLRALVQRERPFRDNFPLWQWAFPLLGVLLLLPGARVSEEWNLFQTSPYQLMQGSRMDPEFQAMRRKADLECQRRNWTEAVRLYEAVLHEYPEEPICWFRMGYCLHSAGMLDEAIVAHEQATHFPQTRSIATYNWACALSLKGQYDEAMEKLVEAADVGFRSRFPIQNDPDLVALVDRPSFREIADKTFIIERWSGANQLSFLLGSWSVYNDQNQLVGVSHIRHQASDDTFHEDFQGKIWPSAESTSQFDPKTKTWTQTWRAASGEEIEYKGGFQDGKILLEGRIENSTGPWSLSRMTLKPMPNRTFFQTIEKSSDGGDSWLTVGEGTYVPLDGFTLLEQKSDERSM